MFSKLYELPRQYLVNKDGVRFVTYKYNGNNDEDMRRLLELYFLCNSNLTEYWWDHFINQYNEAVEISKEVSVTKELTDIIFFERKTFAFPVWESGNSYVGVNYTKAGYIQSRVTGQWPDRSDIENIFRLRGNIDDKCYKNINVTRGNHINLSNVKMAIPSFLMERVKNYKEYLLEAGIVLFDSELHMTRKEHEEMGFEDCSMDNFDV